ARALPTDPVALRVHGEEDGSWKSGRLPLDEEGVLSVSDVDAEGVAAAARALWQDGVSTAAVTAGPATGSESSARGLLLLSAQLDAQGADVLPVGAPVRAYVRIDGGPDRARGVAHQ